MTNTETDYEVTQNERRRAEYWQAWVTPPDEADEDALNSRVIRRREARDAVLLAPADSKHGILEKLQILENECFAPDLCRSPDCNEIAWIGRLKADVAALL